MTTTNPQEASHEQGRQENLEFSPGNQESAEPAEAGFFVSEGKRKLPRWLVPVLALGVGGTIAGGVALTGGNESDSSHVSAEEPDTGTQEASVPTMTPRPTTTEVADTIEQEQDPAMQPILITGNTPESIIEQFAHNRLCSYNAPTYEEQVRCLTHYIGDLANAGSVATVILETIHQINDYRASDDPEFVLDVEIELIDSEFRSWEFVAIVSETDHGGTVYRRLHFNRSYAHVENLSLEEDKVGIWILTGIDILEPGEVSFDSD